MNVITDQDNLINLSQENKMKATLEMQDEISFLKEQNTRLKSELEKTKRNLKLACQKIVEDAEKLSKSNLLKRRYQTKLSKIRKLPFKILIQYVL